MSHEMKLLERIRRDPRDVKPADLFEVLRAEGVEVRSLGSGTHVGLVRGEQRMTMAVTHDDAPLKVAYVRNALKTFGLDKAADALAEAKREHRDLEVEPAEDGGFVAEIPSMPGCFTHGETRAAALANLEDAKSCWLALGER